MSPLDLKRVYTVFVWVTKRGVMGVCAAQNKVRRGNRTYLFRDLNDPSTPTPQWKKSTPIPPVLEEVGHSRTESTSHLFRIFYHHYGWRKEVKVNFLCVRETRQT